ncbi:hypothetical protein Ocin01_13448 [Orchesella cincta]|uniref:Uncharacterized protein n=1 Tax=Orchesella cincta TaxID=48709 RepID=A0A1D2MK87_ORCCI|nr:hypothetical protein Ocin01_13448 [Orchesella cincta]
MCDDITDCRRRRSGTVNVEWVNKMLDIKSSPSSNETDLTWEDPAELCAAWNEAIASLKLASETISNQLRAYCEEARSSQCSTYDLEPLHRRRSSLGSSKLLSEWNTCRSTPACHSALELPSFLQSTISVQSADHQEEVKVKASVSRGILKMKKERKNVRHDAESFSSLTRNHADEDQAMALSSAVGPSTRGRTTPEVNPDWEYDYQRSSWQTSGVTRSEVEYQNRKNASPVVPTEDASVIEIRVKSQADIRIHNAEKRPENFQKKHERRSDTTEAKSRYHQLCQDLEEVRQLDYKMRSYIKRLQNDAKCSKGADANERSINKLLHGVEEVLKQVPVSSEQDGSDALEKRIHNHLKKIRHQIKLVEKYNRAVLEKLSKSEVNSNNKPPHQSPENEIRMRKKSTHFESTRATGTGTRSPAENSQPQKSHFNNQPEYDGQNTFRRKLGSAATASSQHQERVSGAIGVPPNIEYWINSSTAPSAGVAVSYERWTWSYVHPINATNSHVPPVYNCKAERMRCDQWTSTDGHQSQMKRTVKNVNTGSHEKGGDHDDRRQRKSQRSTWDHLSLLDQDDANANYERASRRNRAADRRTLEQATATDPDYGKRTFSRKSIGIGFDEERTTLEQGTVTTERVKRRGTSKSTGMEQNRERRTLEQGTLTNEDEADGYKWAKRSFAGKSTDMNHGERRTTLEKGTLTNQYDDQEALKRTGTRRSTNTDRGKTVTQDEEVKRTFTNRSTSFERRESRRTLNQGTCTEKRRTRWYKSIPKMNLKRDGWTFTEKPKPREKEIQTVTPFSDLSRSPRYQRNISEREMRERTARLRANDTVLLERRRIEEEKARRAANILIQKTYANKIRCHRKGAGLNIDIPTDVSVLGDDDSRSLSMSAND